MGIKLQCACSLEKIISEKTITVVGGGENGKNVINEIERIQGDVHNIVAIMDNDENKQETTYKDIPIISICKGAETLKSCVLLITMKKYKPIIRQLNKMKEFEGWESYIYPLMKEGWLWESDKELLYSERILRYAIFQYGINLKRRNTENYEELMEIKRNELRTSRKFVIPKMVFIVTNRCTLRCAGCLGRVPNFVNPGDMDVNIVLRDMKLFLECVDECISVEIAGGEPLLYPHMDILLDYLIQQKKVLSIQITTNGTVIPNEKTLEYMSNEKVRVGVSDYGMLDRLAKVVYVFEKAGVHFEVYSDQQWREPGDLGKRNKSEELLMTEYENCWDAFNCKVIVNGRLFVCPRYARAYMQNVQNFEKDSVSIIDLNDLEERRKAIYDLYMLDYAESCDYCDYASPDYKVIKPGEQIDHQFYQSQYTIVKRKNF